MSDIKKKRGHKSTNENTLKNVGAKEPPINDDPNKDPLEEDIPSMLEDASTPKRVKLDEVETDANEMMREHYETQLQLANQETEEIKEKYKVFQQQINERDSNWVKTIMELQKEKARDGKSVSPMLILRFGLLRHLNYTKSKHPEFLKGSFDDSTEDLNLVKLAIKTFEGFEHQKRSLQNGLNSLIEKVRSLTGQLEASRNACKVLEQAGQEKEIQLKISKRKIEELRLGKCCRKNKKIECQACKEFDDSYKNLEESAARVASKDLQLEKTLERMKELELEKGQMKIRLDSRIQEATKKLDEECQHLKAGQLETQKFISSLSSTHEHQASQLRTRSQKAERACAEIRRTLERERIQYENEMKAKQQIIEGMEKAAAKKDLQFKKRMSWARDQIKEFLSQKKMIEKQRGSGYIGVSTSVLNGEETRIKIAQEVADGLKKLLSANEKKLVQKSIEKRSLEVLVEKARKDVEHIKRISIKTIMAEIEDNDKKWSRSMAEKTQEIINLKAKYESGNPPSLPATPTVPQSRLPVSNGQTMTNQQPVRMVSNGNPPGFAVQTHYLTTKQGQRFMLKAPAGVGQEEIQQGQQRRLVYQYKEPSGKIVANLSPPSVELIPLRNSSAVGHVQNASITPSQEQNQCGQPRRVLVQYKDPAGKIVANPGLSSINVINSAVGRVQDAGITAGQEQSQQGQSRCTLIQYKDTAGKAIANSSLSPIKVIPPLYGSAVGQTQDASIKPGVGLSAPRASRVILRDGKILYQVKTGPVDNVQEVVRLD